MSVYGGSELYEPDLADDDVTLGESSFRALTAFCEPNVPLEGVTALAFDHYEEALWTGTATVCFSLCLRFLLFYSVFI